MVLGFGSNLGDRRLNVRRAIDQLWTIVRIVRISSLYETGPVDSPPGSPPFLNLVAAGFSALPARELLLAIHAVEAQLGRRRSIPNAPRTIDIDLLLYGAKVRRGNSPVLPHPRYAVREFVLAPLRELRLPWVDPSSGKPLRELHGAGDVRCVGPLY